MNTLNSHQIQKIEQLAQEAQRNPQAYRRKVIALAWLGYAYFGLLASGALGLGGATLYAVISGHKAWLLYLLAKFIWAPFALVILLGRVFFLRLQPPQGIAINARDYPELFTEIESIRAQLKSQPIHQVLISHEFNAAVASLPRFGVLGWPRHYLLLGLPLLQQLDRASLRAVLAHEFGHLSRTHTRTGHWIYRLRLSWELILQQLQLQRSWGLWLVRPFLRWYAPFFNAYSFVFARSNEYEADRCALDVAGQQALARALSSVSTLSDPVEQFWQQMNERARHEPTPPSQVLEELRQALSAFSNNQRWATLQHAMAETTGYQDTHPCLADRLAAVGAQPQLPDPGTQISAAEELLTPQLQQQLEQHWAELVKEAWQYQHQLGQRLEEKRRNLELKASQGELSADEEYQLGYCLQELQPALLLQHVEPQQHPVLQHFQHAIQLNPEHADAHFALGQALAKAEDPRCEDLLLRARDLKPVLRLASAELLLNFALRHKPQPSHAAYVAEFEAAHSEMQQAQLERSQISPRDQFLPHRINDQGCALLSQMIQRYPEVRGAYFMRKQVKLFPEQPVYVLALNSKKNNTAYAELVEELGNSLEDASLVVFTKADAPDLFKKLRNLEGTALFEHNKAWWR